MRILQYYSIGIVELIIYKYIKFILHSINYILTLKTTAIIKMD